MKFVMSFIVSIIFSNCMFAEVEFIKDVALFHGPQKIVWVNDSSLAIGKWDGS